MTSSPPSPALPLFRAPSASAALPAVAALLESGQLAQGPAVAAFEARLSEFLGNPSILATYDRSTALMLALRGAGVAPGDEVLVSPLVCLATAMPILALGAHPVWCDVDPATGMPSPATLPARVSARARALIVYHWGGDIAPLTALRDWADARGLALIEDAAAALGGEYQGRRIGNTDSDYTVLSFYAVNTLSLGEGGALACRRPEDLARLRWLRRYGIHQPDFRLPGGDLNPASDIPSAGYNACLSALHATVGLAQFEMLPERLARARRNAARLDAAVRGIPGLTALHRAADAVPGWWVYALRARRRDTVIAGLHARGIGAQRLHLRNDRYRCFAAAPHALPGVDRFDAENLAVPCGWWVDEAGCARIIDALAACA